MPKYLGLVLVLITWLAATLSRSGGTERCRPSVVMPLGIKIMSTQTINISLPEELVKKIDNAAKAELASRSDYIRQALVGKLKADKIDAS